ncbi:AraC family transcriptional regulator [Labilibacter marinus]|uniref:AraC family transcriptional regulator n=1 Tax=Labilibacter marinus TaxID=1477105 RepID=UPI00094FDB1A|nr:AraC family transcriptional regulator [Labilibacter marinus]
MSILNEQVLFPANSSIILKRKNEPHFTFPFHYHKEYELVYVEKGYGKRYVGGKVEDFSDGDMVLLAPFIAHCWESDKAFYHNKPQLKVKGIVVQLPNDFFKTVISSYPEFIGIKHLLENSKHGLKIIGKTKKEIVIRLNEMFQLTGLKRLFFFLEMLQLVHESKDYELIGLDTEKEEYKENTRLGKVFTFINEHYSSSIYLKDLCLITGLTSTGFSLWFKRNTAKTFSNFLQEYRISKACELLRKKENVELKIAEISFQVGFENLSNFNRVFKKVTELTPKEYRSLF